MSRAITILIKRRYENIIPYPAVHRFKKSVIARKDTADGAIFADTP
jgi:hypothetical protein